MSVVVRETAETKVRVEIAKGTGKGAASTGHPFFDHMLKTLARYAALDLTIQATGDLTHHLMEDVAIAVGAAVRQITPATAARYGDRFIAMDDALVHAAIDVGGRAYYRGKLPNHLYQHWMRSFADNARATLHIRVLRGSHRHHILEAAFKALGLALREALAESGSVFSTKGAVSFEVK